MPPLTTSPTPPSTLSLQSLTSVLLTLLHHWETSPFRTPPLAAYLHAHALALHTTYTALLPTQQPNHPSSLTDPSFLTTYLPSFLRTLHYASHALPAFPLPSPPSSPCPSPPPSFRPTLLARVLHLQHLPPSSPASQKFAFLLDPAARLNPEWTLFLSCALALMHLWRAREPLQVYVWLRRDVDGFLGQCGGEEEEEEEEGKCYGGWVGGMLVRLVRVEEGVRGVVGMGVGVEDEGGMEKGGDGGRGGTRERLVDGSRWCRDLWP